MAMASLSWQPQYALVSGVGGRARYVHKIILDFHVK
jgi:hypothetical protein